MKFGSSKFKPEELLSDTVERGFAIIKGINPDENTVDLAVLDNAIKTCIYIYDKLPDEIFTHPESTFRIPLETNYKNVPIRLNTDIAYFRFLASGLTFDDWKNDNDEYEDAWRCLLPYQHTGIRFILEYIKTETDIAVVGLQMTSSVTRQTHNAKVLTSYRIFPTYKLWIVAPFIKTINGVEEVEVDEVGPRYNVTSSIATDTLLALMDLDTLELRADYILASDVAYMRSNSDYSIDWFSMDSTLGFTPDGIHYPVSPYRPIASEIRSVFTNDLSFYNVRYYVLYNSGTTMTYQTACCKHTQNGYKHKTYGIYFDDGGTEIYSHLYGYLGPNIYAGEFIGSTEDEMSLCAFGSYNLDVFTYFLHYVAYRNNPNPSYDLSDFSKQYDIIKLHVHSKHGISDISFKSAFDTLATKYFGDEAIDLPPGLIHVDRYDIRPDALITQVMCIPQFMYDDMNELGITFEHNI